MVMIVMATVMMRCFFGDAEHWAVKPSSLFGIAGVEEQRESILKGKEFTEVLYIIVALDVN